MITFPDSSPLQQCSQKCCFSFLSWTGASPDLPGVLGLGEDGWRSDLAAVGGGGSRKQAPSGIIHPNGKTEVGSGGAGSHPNRVRGRDALLFSVQISALPPFLHASLFQSQTGCQISSQTLIVCWFLDPIPHLGL